MPTPVKKLKTTPHLVFYRAETSTELPLQYTDNGVSAGFPSPADDYLDIDLDLNRDLIKNPSATFYARVKGESMQDMGIDDGDLLIIDKSLEPKNDAVAVCFIDDEFTLKRIQVEQERVWLMPANNNYEPIQVTEANNFMVWGVVIYTVKKMFK